MRVACVLKGCMHAPHGDPVEGEADMHQLRRALLRNAAPINVVKRCLQERQTVGQASSQQLTSGIVL